MKKIQIIIAKAITIIVTLGIMFSLVLYAHQEQKELAEKNTSVHIEPKKVFFQSSKVVADSVIEFSSIGISIEDYYQMEYGNKSKSTVEKNNTIDNNQTIKSSKVFFQSSKVNVTGVGRPIGGILGKKLDMENENKSK